ncbi:MAG: metal-dependent transcriptional regulator [Thermoprotei archaeon]|nr:MAG: metal-dependent transcriptional regulator [Thermoprotei archaeon]
MKKALTGRAEDYLRAIYDIVKAKRYARIRDIARELGVKPPSVVKMMKKLHQMGLVMYEKYGVVTLTPQGEDIARVITRRHEMFKKFLEIILVPKEIALRDSHILEHQLHPKTVLQFMRFVEFFTNAPEHPKFVSRWLEQFKKYCEEKERQCMDS